MSLELEATALRLKIASLLRDYPILNDDPFLRADMLEAETEIKELLTKVHRTLSDAMALRDGSQERLEELLARRERFVARIGFCRDLIASIMASADLHKIELPEVTVSLRQGSPELLGASDPGALPDELVKVTRVPNRTKIREALQRGETVDGYSLGNAAPHLMVRVR